MSPRRKSKPRPAKTSRTTPSIVWFDIPADDLGRAKKFYGALFGWKIGPFPGMPEYWHIDTGGGDETPDGGLMARKHPEHPITIYVNVKSVSASGSKVEKLGGHIVVPKTAVPHMGYFAVCQDTEHNTFALWEKNTRAT